MTAAPMPADWQILSWRHINHRLRLKVTATQQDPGHCTRTMRRTE